MRDLRAARRTAGSAFFLNENLTPPLRLGSAIVIVKKILTTACKLVSFTRLKSLTNLVILDLNLGAPDIDQGHSSHGAADYTLRSQFAFDSLKALVMDFDFGIPIIIPLSAIFRINRNW